MNAKQYEQFMDRVRENDEVCCHGHFGCSDTYLGRCCDEEYANLSDANRRIIDGEHDE